MPAYTLQRRVIPHQVFFEHMASDPHYWRAYCSCGWLEHGTEDQVKLMAAGHDLFMGKEHDRR